MILISEEEISSEDSFQDSKKLDEKVEWFLDRSKVRDEVAGRCRAVW